MANQEITKVTGEKRQLDAVFWGGVLLWAGIIFGAEQLGLLPQVGAASAWSWIFLGAGLYGLLIGISRLALSSYPPPATSDWVWAVIILIFGLVGFLSLAFPWGLILIIIGVAILGDALLRR